MKSAPGATATVNVFFRVGGGATNVDFFLNYDESLIDENKAVTICANTVPQLDSFNCTVDTVGNRIRGIGVNLAGGTLSSNVLARVRLPILKGANGTQKTSTVTGNFADSNGNTTPFTTNWKLEVSGALARPTGVRATDGTFSDKVRVTFNTVPGATVYRVFRCLTTGQTCGTPIGFPKIGTFDDKNAVPGVVYFYRVRACTTTKCSGFSVLNNGSTSTGPAAPARPTTIRASDGTFPVRVRVTWDKVPGTFVYRVFRCPTKTGACGTPVGFPKNPVFDDAKGVTGVVYYYRVRACTQAICGKFSVQNPGHRGSIPSAKADAAIEVAGVNRAPPVATPIPVLSGVFERGLLIMMMLGLGMLLIKHKYIHLQE